LVSLAVRAFWIAGSWISGATLADIPAGVRHLVRRPHPQHRQRRQNTAEDDQQRRGRRPPAEPASASPPRPAARFGHLGARGFTFGALARTGALTCGRLALAVGAGHGSPPFPSNPGAARRPLRWIAPQRAPKVATRPSPEPVQLLPLLQCPRPEAARRS